MVDAAVGELIDSVSFTPEIPGIGTIVGTVEAEPGMLVCKLGSKTGYTEGRVVSIDEDVVIKDGVLHATEAIRFVRQIRIIPVRPYLRFAEFGDSGSVVVEKSTRRAVGLFFAGGHDGSYALANPIRAVEQALDITLAG